MSASSRLTPPETLATSYRNTHTHTHAILPVPPEDSARESTSSPNRWRAWPRAPASPACTPDHARLWLWDWGGSRNKPSDSAGRHWLSPHPSKSRGRTLAIFSSRRKGRWVKRKHWTRSQELELLPWPAWHFLTGSSVPFSPLRADPMMIAGSSTLEPYYPRTLYSGIPTPVVTHRACQS